MKTLLILADYQTAVPVAHPAAGAPIMLKIFFWVFLAIWGFGGFTWASDPARQLYWTRGGSLILVFLFAVLGWYVFGF